MFDKPGASSVLHSLRADTGGPFQNCSFYCICVLRRRKKYTFKVWLGFTAGSPYDIDGGAASFVCLPQHPTWGKYQDGRQDSGGFISGTEFEPAPLNFFPQNMDQQDAPCVVCRVPRATTLMIAGRTNCYAGWTMEYTGYLMTGHTTQKGGTDYVCIDANPEAVYHGEASLNGKLLYPTEVKCGSLPCQEYPDGRELACVVCSKWQMLTSGFCILYK